MPSFVWLVQEINLSNVTDGGAPQFGGKLKSHVPVTSCGAAMPVASARRIFPPAVRNSIRPSLHAFIVGAPPAATSVSHWGGWPLFEVTGRVSVSFSGAIAWPGWPSSV